MNLHELCAEALGLLHLGSEASTVSFYFNEFRKFANDAVINISRKFRQTRTERVKLSDELTYQLGDLERICMRVINIRDEHGNPLHWMQTGMGTGEVKVFLPIPVYVEGEEYYVKIEYEFRPARMVAPEDIPELPEFCCDCIPYYIAAQHNFTQGGDNVGMGNFFMSAFQTMLQDLPFNSYGEVSARRLHNNNDKLI